MFQALFNSLSGLFSFSKNLNTVSHNVANMNTPGFRGSDTFMSNLSGGHGSQIAGQGLRMSAGDPRLTESNTQLAIDGSGLFILRDGDGNLFYTRAGQFEFDGDGFLVDSVTQYKVMGIDAGGNLIPMNRTGYMTLPAAPTTTVNISGNFNVLPGATAIPLPNGIKIYDKDGVSHDYTVSIVNKATSGTSLGEFIVSIKNSAGTVVGSGEIHFDTTLGTLLAGTAPVTFTETFGGVPQTVTLDFGTPGLFTGSTTNESSVGMSLVTDSINGNPEITIDPNKITFDDKGIMQFVYSASQKKAGPQIALAWFSDESSFELVGDRLLSGGDIAHRQIGRPGESLFGDILGKHLEGSNVDLTQEFADMIIIQRGYQASSRVMTVSNEMIEQLYNSTRGG
jgi:flagellar hook protein FlgE